MNCTVITHFLNEEILLPAWLIHHRKLFTHGIMLDAGSTDNSCNIIKSFCPSWEIVKIPKEKSGSPMLDIYIVQEFEAKITRWKIVLNVGEFLIVDDLQRYVSQIHDVGIRCTGIILVEENPNINDPFFLKNCNFGYIESGNAWNGQQPIEGKWPTTPIFYRSRLLHQMPQGKYSCGRHTTDYQVTIRDDIFVAWIGRGSPELYSKRCNQWASSTTSISMMGQYYIDWSNLEKCKDFYKSEVQKSYNLFETIPLYEFYINKIYFNK